MHGLKVMSVIEREGTSET